MSTYKVIQDIEAEDKLLGPLTLRQFIYAGIAALCLYLSAVLFLKGAGYLIVFFLPVALITGFFAFPWGRDQPTEIWALAKIRFFLKPRKRIWNQTGIKDLVTITVPKKIERIYTNGLSQTEVQSRLSALANTIDSRGWAIKNVAVNLYAQPSQMAVQGSSDRLIDPMSMPQDVPSVDILASDDMLDAQNNPLAQQFDSMMNASAQSHHQQLLSQMSQPQASSSTTQTPGDYWFLNQPAQNSGRPNAASVKAQVVVPGATDEPAAVTAATPTAAEEAFAHSLKQTHNPHTNPYGHLQSVQPLSAQLTAAPQSTPTLPSFAPPSYVPEPPNSAILGLANNNDLNVATIAREAEKARTSEQPLDQDEVVISLH